MPLGAFHETLRRGFEARRERNRLFSQAARLLPDDTVFVGWRRNTGSPVRASVRGAFSRWRYPRCLSVLACRSGLHETWPAKVGNLVTTTQDDDMVTLGVESRWHGRDLEMHEDVAPEGLEWDYLNRRITVAPKKFVLELCVAMSRHVPGHIVEFGVANGDSTRILRRALGRSEKRIYACDSFEGLREKFENAEIGTFACKPPRIRGVEIVKGYFEDSLTPELAARVGRVAFASLDADLYSSTSCALKWLTPLLGSGSLLLFDEFLGEKESEKRAFEDWSRETGLRTVRVAEFLREPSGWGTRIDKRPLFQVIGDDLLPKRAVSLRARFRAGRMGRIARRARDLVFDRK